MDAAMALGATAHLLDDTSAMDKLIQFYTDRCSDEDTHRPKQHLFDNLSEQLVNQVSFQLYMLPYSLRLHSFSHILIAGT